MPVVHETVSLSPVMLGRIQEELQRLDLSGWLLFDFRGINGIAGGLIGLPALSRRWFVLIPRSGAPIALTHRIEQQPWRGWIGENRQYLAWRELESELGRLLEGRASVAMEYNAGDAVPYLDRVPAGVIEMVRAAGAEVVSSADLVSAIYARWSDEGLAAHRRSASALQEVARDAFRWIGEGVRSGQGPTEWAVRERIVGELARRGVVVGVDSVVAANENAANPHHSPAPNDTRTMRAGDLVLIDLWGKESADAIYADQTWMGYLGEVVPERIETIWAAARDARLAAVELIRERSRAGAPVTGAEVDDAARAVITARGFGDHFIHRTGHSIDREIHGSGPNIDNLESRDGRTLIPGIGFSLEPGIYLPGDVGFRTEVDVYMGPDGPEVTTPDPQHDLIRVSV